MFFPRLRNVNVHYNIVLGLLNIRFFTVWSLKYGLIEVAVRGDGYGQTNELRSAEGAEGPPGVWA